MKIKIALFGLLFANSITHPIYADPDRYLEEDEIEEEDRQSAKKPYTLESEENSEAVKEDDKVNPQKLATKLDISPSIVYQDGEYSTKNGPKMGLQFKANVPKAWCNKDAIMEVSVSSSGKDFSIKKAAVIIGNMVTIGHTSSIFGYAKADPDVLISPGGTVLQFKFERTFDWFQFGCALESPLPMQLGLFDKTQERGEKENGPNRLDKSSKYFKVKSTYPTVGLNLGVVGDDFNIALSGLLRVTDYKHIAGGSDKEKDPEHCGTVGGHLGLQYQIVPKQFTITLQGAFVHGLGDYLSGLAPIQSDKERNEMCAVYYLKDSEKLSCMDVYGFGGTLQYCATPKWTFSVRGSYLTFTENKDKPGFASSDQWNVVPKVAYKVNKHFTISGGYGLAKERRIDERQEKGRKQRLSGNLQFSL